MRLSSDEQNGRATLRFTAWRLHESGVSEAVAPAFVLPAARAHDGLLTDPPSDASVPETASSRQREGHVLFHFTLPRPVLPHEGPEAAARVERRAMAMWPRLDHRALRRCHGDTARIAVYVSRRT